MAGDGTAEHVDRPRGRGRPKGIPASDAQKAAGKANLKAGHKTRKAKGAQRRAVMELEKPRWKQLEDGELDVSDLTMDELIRGACANNDGTWEGKRHKLSTRLLGRMETERRRRIRRDFDKLAPDAISAFEEMINDADNPAQRLAASKMVIEHQIGSVPKEVHVSVETDWDRLQDSGFTILRGTEAVEVEDIVDAEVVDE